MNTIFNSYNNGYEALPPRAGCGVSDVVVRAKTDVAAQGKWCPIAQKSYGNQDGIFVPGALLKKGGAIKENYCSGCTAMTKYVTLASTSNGGCSCGY